MVKAKVTRSSTPIPAPFGLQAPVGITVAAWGPDEKAETPPEEVHLILNVQSYESPLIVRIKSPDTLAFIIEELAEYRRKVWPDAEPLDLELNELR